MRESNQEEHDFWDKLLNLRLVPQSTAYGLEEDLKKDLAELRNKWIAIFAVCNAIWMVLIYSLATKGKLLSVANSNPVGLVVLVIFSFVLFIQFIAMIIHRLTTATHFLARAPYLFGDKYNAAYALNDRDIADKNRPISHLESKQKTSRIFGLHVTMSSNKKCKNRCCRGKTPKSIRNSKVNRVAYGKQHHLKIREMPCFDVNTKLVTAMKVSLGRPVKVNNFLTILNITLIANRNLKKIEARAGVAIKKS
ncbi:hypothetical protein DPMN_031435 [Dreissena polymorpha]|uniref:Uncharacterized protein n=1 Tax=Dreissena polymorpha TaxID=45954 RepID=A0A9D4RJ37_DREPO|nr:hypothetical protein DPMN_031435 [Dreissena polymorpha]